MWLLADLSRHEDLAGVVHYYVNRAVKAQDLSAMEKLRIDDTRFRMGQSYASVFCDLALS